MGCSGSNIRENLNFLPRIINGKKRLSLIEERAKYNTNHDNFESIILDPEIRNYFKNIVNADFIAFFENFYGMYKYRFDQYNMIYQEVKDVILEKLVESQLKEDLLYKEWNVSEFITNLIEEQHELNEDASELAKAFFSTTSRYFPSKQKGCVFVLNNFENVEKWGSKNYLTNLKFNAEYSLSVLNIIITPFLFKNENIIYDLCEVIESNHNLITVTITVANIYETPQSPPHHHDEKISQVFTPDKKHISLLAYLFHSIRCHTNIKVFSFANYANYMYSLTTEVNNALIGLLSTDRLISISIIKINLLEEIEKSVVRVIENLKNLKFFLFDFFKPDGIKEISNTNISLLKGLKSAIIGNKKLLGAYISLGKNFEINREELKNEVKGANLNLKFFECVKEFDFFK